MACPRPGSLGKFKPFLWLVNRRLDVIAPFRILLNRA